MAMNTKRTTKISRRPILRYLLPLEKPKRHRGKAAKQPWPIPVGTIANPHLHTIVALGLIGVLLMLNIVLRFPDLGGIIAEYNKF
jgi:hypothetical protein